MREAAICLHGIGKTTLIKIRDIGIFAFRFGLRHAQKEGSLLHY